MQRKLILGAVWALILLVAQGAGADRLTFTMTAGPYQIAETDEGFQRIEMAGFDQLQVPGKPMLPVRQYHFALPPGAQVTGVNITGDGRAVQEGTYRIEPAAGVIRQSDDEQAVQESKRNWQTSYDAVYLSDVLFPEQAGEDLGVGGLRKYTLLRVAFYPFAYRPISGQIAFTPRATVEVNYRLVSPGGEQDRRVQRSLTDRVSEDRAAELLDNYDQARTWYTPATGASAAKSTYNYVIITTTSLESAVSDLVDWKEDIGHTVNVVTTSWISSSYSGWDLVEKIRNFLIDKYIDWGIEYVLLAGNIDVIPMRYCYPDGHSSATPTDYYYADLTGNWNSDGDGYYGEFGEDDVDFIAEVYVGRIPWSSSTTLSNICDKLVATESDTGSWKDNALLLGAFTNFANEDHSGWPATDGAYLGETLISGVLTGWGTTTMYEKSGLATSSFSCDYPLTRTNVTSQWSANDYGIVAWAAHGGSNAAYRKYWYTDDGDGVPEGGEMSWPIFINNDDVTSLDDDHPSIVFCASCENGHPEYSHLARELIKNGSAGAVAATRVSWGIVGWTDPDDGGNDSFAYYFYDYLINRGQKTGPALYNSKYYCKTHMWQNWQNMFVFCLYGDPGLDRVGMAPTPQVLAVTPHPNVYVVSPTSDVSASFDRPMNVATLNDTTFRAYGDLGGRYQGSVGYDANTRTATLNPSGDFLAGEDIRVMASSYIFSQGGTSVSGGHSWFFRIKAPGGSGSFGEDSTFGSGMDPGAICSGDFDGDGHVDLAVANLSLDNLSVWINDGSGAFSLDATYGVGGDPRGMAAGDLDGDGYLDLVVADSSDHQISVLINDGDGTFAAHQTYGTGQRPRAVFVADLDGDGYLDVTTANSGSGNLSVLINDGDGTFAAHQTYGTDSAPRSISGGDLNGDGHVDLVTANYSSGNVSVLINDGDGTFAADVTYAVGDGPHCVCVGDLEDDGIADLAVVNRNSDNVTILLNGGNGDFSVDGNYAVGDEPLFLWVSDLDDDEDGDLMVASRGADQVFVLLNMGNGSLESATGYGVGDNPVALCGGDYDGDGDLDLATANTGSNDISVLFNIDALEVAITSPARHEMDVPAGTEITARFNSAVDSTTLSDSTLFVCGSLTGRHWGQVETGSDDSTIVFDPFISFSAGEAVTTILTTGVKSSIGTPMNTGYQWSFFVATQGNGVFDEDSTFSVGDSPQGIVAADLNGDGHIDLATANYLISSVGVLFNQGDGTYQLDSLYSVGYGPVCVCALDLEGDGDLDLASANAYAGTISILLNSGGIFSTDATYTVGVSPYSICTADLDGDGDEDLAVSNANDDNVSILLNQGDGSFAAPVTYAVGWIPRGICAGDVDGDGDADLLVANYEANTLSVLTNRGNGIFTTQQVYSLSGSPRSLGIGDLNGDGHLDVALGDYNENLISVVFNQGDGSFGPDTAYVVEGGPTWLFVGDLNGDGYQDLAVSRAPGNDVLIMKNDGLGLFPDQQAYEVGNNPLGVCAGDLDGDGALDLAVACYNDDLVSVLYNSSSGWPPAAVSDLTATLAGNALHLSWQAVTADEGGNPITVDHYTVYRHIDPRFVPVAGDSIGSTAETYYDDPAAALKDPGTNHYYVVKAVDSQGRKSADSSTVGEFDKTLLETAKGKGEGSKVKGR